MRDPRSFQARSLGALIAVALCLLLSSPTHAADLTVDRLTANLGSGGVTLGQQLATDLQGVVDKSAVIFDKIPAPTGDPTDEKATNFRVALRAAWEEAIAPVFKKLATGITAERVKILDLTAESNPRYGPLGTSFKDQTVEIGNALSSAVKGFDLSSLEPGAQGKDDAAKLLGKLKDELVKTFGESWGRASKEILASFEATSVGEQIADAQKEIAKIIAQNEADALADLRKATGFSRVVRCVFSESPLGLACNPGARISASEVSEIVISKLPAGKRISVVTYSADEILSSFGIDRGAPSGSVAAVFGCPLSPSGKPQEALACDQVTYNANSVDQVVVALYKGRALLPQYGGFLASARRAALRLRPQQQSQSANRAVLAQGDCCQEDFRKGLSILVSGKAAQIYVQVKVEEDEDSEAIPMIASAEIPIGYERWGFETGGFFAISRLTDQEVIQESIPNSSNVKVLRIDDVGGYAQESGLFLNFIPRNYPLWGWGIGFSPDSSRPLSMYVGPSLRLRSFGQRAIANISAGMTMRSVKRFPGLTPGNDPYPATSPLLTGRQEYQIKPYVLLQLGFSFGPIPGPNGGSEETSAP